MQLEYLQYFLEVVKCKSINQASKNLHFNQSNLSKIMISLEENFGTILFNRSNQGITLTKHGEAVAQWADQLLSARSQLLETFAKDNQLNEQALTGNLTIHVPANITGHYYFSFIKAFSAKYPQITINLEEKGFEDIIAQVQLNPHDIGIVILLEKLHQQLIAETLIAHFYEPITPVVYAAKNSHFARTHKTTSFKALSKEPLVIYKSSSVSSSPVEDLLNYFGQCNIKYTLSNLKAFYAVLKEGECITIGIASSEAFISSTEGLIAIPIRDKFTAYVGLISQKTSLDNPIAAAFIQFYLERKGQHLKDNN